MALSGIVPERSKMKNKLTDSQKLKGMRKALIERI